MATLALDIESDGKNILAIGICYVDKEGNITKKTFARQVIVDDFEPSCKEWWKDKQEILDKIDQTAEDAKTKTLKEMIELFRLFLDGLEIVLERDKLGKVIKTEPITFLSDHPSFDIGRINELLHLHKLKEVALSSIGEYRSVEDTWGRMEMIPPKTREHIQRKIQKECPHDHWPENDAHHIYLQYKEAQVIKEKLASFDTELLKSLS